MRAILCRHQKREIAHAVCQRQIFHGISLTNICTTQVLICTDLLEIFHDGARYNSHIINRLETIRSWTENPRVGGSIPSLATKIKDLRAAGILVWNIKATNCAFGGSKCRIKSHKKQAIELI